MMIDYYDVLIIMYFFFISLSLERARKLALVSPPHLIVSPCPVCVLALTGAAGRGTNN